MFARMLRRSTTHRARRPAARFRPGLAGLETRTMLSSIPTTTALTAPTATAYYGQVVDFKATVSADAPSHATPAGSVQLKIDGTAYGRPVSLSTGTAVISDAALAAGSHAITATFLPSTGSFSTSTAKTVKQVVDADATRTSLAVTAASLSVSGITAQAASAARTPGSGASWGGVSVTLTATVANVTPHGGGIPTGTVQFQLNGSPLGAPVTLSGGRASVTIAHFSAHNPAVTVVYTSNTRNFSGSSAALSSSQLPLAVAKVMAGEGATPDQIAAALKDATGASDLTVASILDGLGDTADQVAESLENIFGDTGTDVGVILDEVGYAGGAIADALVDVFGMAANQIAELFTNTLGMSQSETEIDMDAAGFNWTFNPDGTASNTTTVTNPDGTTTSTTAYYDSNFALTNATSTTTVTNSDGSTTTTVNYYGYNGSLTFDGSSVTTTISNPDGSSTVVQDIYDSSGNLMGSSLMIYNSDGQLTSWATYNAAGQQTGGSDDGDNGSGDNGSGDNGGSDSGAGDTGGGDAGGGGGGGGDSGLGDNGGHTSEDIVVRHGGSSGSGTSTSGAR